MQKTIYNYNIKELTINLIEAMAPHSYISPEDLEKPFSATTKIHIICQHHHGFNRSFNDIVFRGLWCQDCVKRIRGSTHKPKLTPKIAMRFASWMGAKVNGPQIVYNKKTYYTWTCIFGHTFKKTITRALSYPTFCSQCTSLKKQQFYLEKVLQLPKSLLITNTITTQYRDEAGKPNQLAEHMTAGKACQQLSCDPSVKYFELLADKRHLTPEIRQHGIEVVRNINKRIHYLNQHPTKKRPIFFVKPSTIAALALRIVDDIKQTEVESISNVSAASLAKLYKNLHLSTDHLKTYAATIKYKRGIWNKKFILSNLPEIKEEES